MTGIILVVGAQVFSAFQMCFEELLLTGRAPTSAKKVVGMEGVWGTTYMIVILILMYFIHGGDNGHVEDTPEGLRLLTGNGFLAFLVVSYMMSISVYNLVGITVGKKMSAVVRCLVDSCRTVVVWVVNLMLHYLVDEKLGSAWQPHTWLQLVGFVILVFGTLLYNEVLTPPRWLTSGTPGEAGERTFSTTSVDNVMRKIDLSAEGMADPGDPIRASGISLDWPQAREGPRPAAQVN
jgi:drug/metabolite transporter (DMT)-like permease